MQNLNSTAHQLLDVAEHCTQMRGFNGFSYKDLQHKVGIKTASIHYYFPTKQDLALSMVERYSERFHDLLRTIAREQEDGLKRLDKLGGLYVDVVRDGRFCLCGMLASDMLSLPDTVNRQLGEFFQLVEVWIAEAIALGKQQQRIEPSVNPEPAAAHFMATLEGGMLIARIQQRPEYLESLVTEALARLTI